MKAVDYLKTMKRMCEVYSYCVGCPLANNDEGLACVDYESDCPEEIVEIVEKWAKENPAIKNTKKIKERED